MPPLQAFAQRPLRTAPRKPKGMRFALRKDCAPLVLTRFLRGIDRFGGRDTTQFHLGLPERDLEDPWHILRKRMPTSSGNWRATYRPHLSDMFFRFSATDGAANML